MKKRILFGAAAVLVVLLLVYGRDLLDLYRLQRYIDDSAAAYQADGGTWPQLADVCMGCHGVAGNSQHQGYPSLAGQPARYVEDQLRKFASGQRANPHMTPLAMSLSDAERARLAEHFARQAPAANTSFEPDPQLREKGQQLVSKAGCAACHGERLMGGQEFARLAGQGVDYLAAQLDAFASGARSEPSGVMKTLSAAASPDERKAIASYLASLAPQAR